VQWVKEILFTSITACVTSQHTSLEENLDLKRIGFQGQFLPCLFNRDRVTVGIIRHLAVAVQMRLARHAAFKGPRWERTEVRLLFTPGLSNADRLAMHYAHIVAHTGGQQVTIQLVKGVHPRDGNQEIAPTKADAPLNPTFLMALSRRAEVRLIQIMAAKSHEGPLLFPHTSLYQRLDGTG
jgi:hypothetical protein